MAGLKPEPGNWPAPLQCTAAAGPRPDPGPKLVELPGALAPARASPGCRSELDQVLSASQVRTFLDCSARWWFKYGLGLREPKTASLALGLAVHRALEANFREKVETGEDLEPLGVVALFRDAWLELMSETQFSPDEDRLEIRRLGERMTALYMDQAAPSIRPAAVELEVAGEIAGVAVRGRVDVLEACGRIVDVKTAARRPAGVSPDYAFQLATYRQITPGASGEARTLVRTRVVQLATQMCSLDQQELRATQALYPLVAEGIRSGLYYPNRQSILCSRRHCAFWRQCEAEFGGRVKE